MSDKVDRRTVLAAPALVAFASATSACAQPAGQPVRSGSGTLVAYFTRSGNTRVIAGTLQRLLGADLFEIKPARPYPEDYEQNVEQARQESERRYEPPLASRVVDLAAYTTVFLGFPIWGGTVPPIIRSFLRGHDLSAKILRPFITHGGYGVGDSRTVLESHARGARIEPSFVMEADQERRTLNEVTSWVDRLPKR